MNNFRVRETDSEFNHWTIADGDTYHTSTEYINEDGAKTKHCKAFDTEAEAQAALNLYLGKNKSEQPKIRKFDTGATRDTVVGKLDYVKALSPIVLRRYVEYLNKHRLQPDGSYRDFDNWKKGIPQETYHSSKGRHFMDTWLLAEGYSTEDNHGPVNEEDALCGEIFNAMGKLHEILKDKVDHTKPNQCREDIDA